MGQGFSRGSGAGRRKSPGGKGHGKGKEKGKGKAGEHKESNAPAKTWKPTKRRKGPDVGFRLPKVIPAANNRLRLIKLNRIKDWLLMEEEFAHNTDTINHNRAELEHDPETAAWLEKLMGSPVIVAVLQEMVDDNHAIVAIGPGQQEWYVNVLSIVDKTRLELNGKVLLSRRNFSVIGLIDDDFGKMVVAMKIEKAPHETFADIGGLDEQIREIREVIELPLSRPELFLEMGIVPQKGVILYGPPGTGKTLLAKAVANSTSATFLRVVGSDLVQKNLGAGPALVREMFQIAEDLSPSIIFIDEIDAIGAKRNNEGGSDGEKEIQRTMLALLNQLDGFDTKADIKVIMATNRIDCLDPALIRPGRIDRKIEIPLPDDQGKKRIFQLQTSRMNLADDINFDDLLAFDGPELSGADIRAICTEAGMAALRERRMKILQSDFKKAKLAVIYKKKDTLKEGMFI